MKSLYILGTEPYVAMAKKPEMPLERLCLKYACPSLASALNKHVQSGSLSRLTHLNIPAVQLSSTGPLLSGAQGRPLMDCLFEKQWPQLTHLTLSNITNEGFDELSLVIVQGKLRNISALSLIFVLSYRFRKIHIMDFLRSEFFRS